MTDIATIEALEALYPAPISPAALVKELPFVTEGYRRLIDASPFVALATLGPEGLDCSPRGDKPGFVQVLDPTTLVMPDRRGNNRLDSLRNIVRDGRVALLFLIPGSGTTFRINGRAKISTDPALIARFVVEDKAPTCVIVIKVEAAYFQCARAIHRSDLWNPSGHVTTESLPSPGALLAEASQGQVGGEAYDAAWPARAKASLW